MFLIETKRAFSRVSFKVSFFLVCTFCVLDILNYPIGKENILTEYLSGYVNTPLQNFVFFKLNAISNLLIIILPIISALSFSDSYIEDMKSGFIQNIYIRGKRHKYLISKYFANFLVGGTAFALPLLLDYIFCILSRPNIQPDPILTGQIIMEGGLLPSLFYSHGNLYTLMWIAIYFFYSGVFASIGLCASKLIKNKFIIIFVPFILYFVIECFCELTNNWAYSPEVFLYLSRVQSFSIIVSEFIFMFIITFIVFCFCGVNNDIYKND